MRNYQHFLFFSSQITEDTVVLGPEETAHAVKVLRLKQNDCFNVTDGKGTIFTCTFDGLPGDTLNGNILERQTLKRYCGGIHLNVGMPDRDAFEAAVVNCAALGAERITPVICDFSQERWWDKQWDRHSRRLTNKMVAAMKQSLYPFLPELDNPVKLETALENSHDKRITADPDGEPLFARISPSEFPVSCFIGPPGGFSGKELSFLQERGSLAVNIAPARLRTELASVVLCGQLIGMNHCFRSREVEI